MSARSLDGLATATRIRAELAGRIAGWTSPMSSVRFFSNCSRRGCPSGYQPATSAASSTRLMPTSITVAPGFTNAGVT